MKIRLVTEIRISERRRDPTRGNPPSNRMEAARTTSSSRKISGKALETDGDAAHDVFRRTHDLQFVVDGRLEQVFVEQVSNRHDHLPLRRTAKSRNGQRLTDLDVESRPELRAEALRHRGA